MKKIYRQWDFFHLARKSAKVDSSSQFNLYSHFFDIFIFSVFLAILTNSGQSVFFQKVGKSMDLLKVGNSRQYRESW
jgi:hypothetical protein